MSAPRLSAVAAWDIPLLDGAVVTLAAIAGRLTTWRARVEGVARTVQSGEYWSGPAAGNSGRTILDLSTRAAAVTRGLQESLARYRHLSSEATLAQELAMDALAAAASAGVVLDDGGGLVEPLLPVLPAMTPAEAAQLTARTVGSARATALAAEALGHAATAAAHAATCGDALVELGVVGASAPATFEDLAPWSGFIGPLIAPQVPVGSAPREVTAWWAALSSADQRAAIRSHPRELGSLDGLPAWVRDGANRLVLDHALQYPAQGIDGTAAAVVAEITEQERSGQPVQLHSLDLAEGTAALALGDLDTAAAVAVLVPGTGNTVHGDLDSQVERAEKVAAAAEKAARGTSVATVAWMGYRTPPGLVEAGKQKYADVAGPRLDGDLDGLAAARAASDRLMPRTTVIAHSYGTVAVDEAADASGTLAADSVVLLGSPGMDDDADSLEVREVFDAMGGDDDLIRGVAWTHWHGWPTEVPWYGSTELPVDHETGHSDYFDPEHPTLAAIGEVAVGRRSAD